MRGLIWGGLGLLAFGLGVWCLSPRSPGPSPVLPIYSHVTGFRLTNQLGRVVTSEDLTGRVWVADIIFTRCPGPCVRMTRELAEVQAALPHDSPVKLVSLTADPEFDTTEVLRKYADGFGADAARWHFLTGRKAEVYDLALKQLLLAAEEIDPAQRTNDADLFIHSTKWVLVDARGSVRGVFEGTEPESRPRLLDAIQMLQLEGER
jgi:protein SCO1